MPHGFVKGLCTAPIIVIQNLIRRPHTARRGWRRAARRRGWRRWRPGPTCCAAGPTREPSPRYPAPAPPSSPRRRPSWRRRYRSCADASDDLLTAPSPSPSRVSYVIFICRLTPPPPLRRSACDSSEVQLKSFPTYGSFEILVCHCYG